MNKLTNKQIDIIAFEAGMYDDVYINTPTEHCQEFARAIESAVLQSLAHEGREAACWCEVCKKIDSIFRYGGMILCPTCGNKRCPHATDHRNECTGSNEPNQKGSSYQYASPPEQASSDDRFCDSNCTHIDHHPGCVRADTADGGEERK